MIVWANFVEVVFFRYLNAPSIDWIGFDKIPMKDLLLLFIFSIFNIPTPYRLRYLPDPVMFNLYTPQWSLFLEYIANFFYIFILRYLTTLSVYILTVFSMICSVIVICCGEYGNICDGFDVYIPHSALVGIVRTFTPILIGYSISRYKKEKDKKYIKKEDENERTSEGIKYSFEISPVLLVGMCSVPYVGEITIEKCKNAIFEIFVTLFIIPLILIIAIIERKPNKTKANFCQWLGKFSFYIYLNHYSLADLLHVWVANNNYLFDYTWIMLIGVYILCLSFANFVRKYFDAPLQRWLSSLFLK